MSNHPDERRDDAEIENLLRQVGARDEPSPALEREVYAAVHAEWRALLDERRSRRRTLIWSVAASFALVVLVATNAFSALTALLMLRFANRQGHMLEARLFELYLRQPYTFHLHRHTAELQKNLLSEVHRVTVGVLGPAVQMISRGFVIVFLLALLLIADPLLALVVGLVLGAGYLAVFGFVQRVLHEVGKLGYHGGIALGRWYPDLADSILIAVTEKRTKAEIDGLASAYTQAMARA